ncbi:MAG: NAD-dependent deacylase [Burkholderiales bacterium]|nr:NAD-dependent deacylase [Burkholderiales bacterium]
MSREFEHALLTTLRRARSIAVLTGAGVSAESGIPTFRDAQTGLWARFRPEDLATPEAFERDPKLVWEWYAWRRDVVAKAAPNAGHAALARLATLVPELALITQNVDGLHQRAGSRDVIELHGNIHRSRCVRENTVVESWADTGDLPPRCPRCGALLRPDVVWFGEMLPAAALERAEAAARGCDVFFSVGTSAAVYPAAHLPLVARDAGATVIEVNKDPTRISNAVTYVLRGPSGEILPQLLAAAWPG